MTIDEQIANFGKHSDEVRSCVGRIIAATQGTSPDDIMHSLAVVLASVTASAWKPAQHRQVVATHIRNYRRLVKSLKPLAEKDYEQRASREG